MKVASDKVAIFTASHFASSVNPNATGLGRYGALEIGRYTLQVIEIRCFLTHRPLSEVIWPLEWVLGQRIFTVRRILATHWAVDAAVRTWPGLGPFVESGEQWRALLFGSLETA